MGNNSVSSPQRGIFAVGEVSVDSDISLKRGMRGTVQERV